MTFRIGDKVVYPNQGVGTVEDISVRPCGPALEQFYLLRFGTGGATVLAPLSKAADIGLRRVTGDSEISSVLTFLEAVECRVNPEWKSRFRENADKMASGDLRKAAEVLKSLLKLHAARPLSLRERKMVDCARRMLVSEISIARGEPEGRAAFLLECALLKAGLRMPR